MGNGSRVLCDFRNFLKAKEIGCILSRGNFMHHTRTRMCICACVYGCARTSNNLHIILGYINICTLCLNDVLDCREIRSMTFT